MVLSEHPAKTSVLRAAGRILVGLGLLGIALAAVAIVAEANSPRTARADGKVIALAGTQPWVRFKTGDKRDVGFRAPTRLFAWSVGQQALVAYDPKQPSDAQLDGIDGRWFAAVLLAAIGSIALLAGAGLEIAGRSASGNARATKV